MTPLFSPVLHSTRPYSHNKTSTGRPLMMPDEVRRLPKQESILLIRGELPLKLNKVLPDEHPDFSKLISVRINNYTPAWRKTEENGPRKEKAFDVIKSAISNQTAMPSNSPYRQMRIWDDPDNNYAYEDDIGNDPDPPDNRDGLNGSASSIMSEIPWEDA